ncbi:MAG: YiiD C-terminal domain-containing protein [Longimicrobiales bacterium]|nr:YiiD C-terminal domain-containing protein [Longimicrobiales bacterium]
MATVEERAGVGLDLEPLESLHARLVRDFPLASALGIQIMAAGVNGVRLEAPFAPNRNGHGSFFGGSSIALALISGWLLVRNWVDAAGIDADVVIQEVNARFEAPVAERVRVCAFPPAPRVWKRFHQMLDRYGRARVEIEMEVSSASEAHATRLLGRYVALASSGG